MTPKRGAPRQTETRLETESPEGNKPSPAQWLLASQLDGSSGYRTLIIHSGPAILSAGLLDRLAGGRVDWMGRDQAALKQVELRLKAHPIVQSRISMEVELAPQDASQFDQVALVAPKSRMLARRWLLTAWQALKPGGKLFLAGPNDLGIRPLIKDAEAIFLPATILGYKKGNRIARLHKPEDGAALPMGAEWLSTPGVQPGTWQEFDFTWQGESWHFYSLPGVFSAGELDDGTRLLLEQLQVHPGADVLDFGCGFGVIGILAAWLGAGSVDLIDNDLLATASAQKNISARQIRNARVLAGDGLGLLEDRRYDLILSNPPFHAGRTISYRVTEDFIGSSGRLLKKGGQLILVANRFIPYEQNLQRFYRKVTRLAEDSRYQVHLASRPLKIRNPAKR